MARLSPWLVVSSSGLLIAASLWSLYQHVYFAETMFAVMTAAWG